MTVPDWAASAPLPRSFYDRPVLTVTRDLLGKVLVWPGEQETQVGRIVEVEAYIGTNDAASHARFGRTKRSDLMFGAPGYAYIYLIYGIYHCLNVTADPIGSPAAILLRALEPLAGITGATNGPGRLCRALGITRQQNGIDLTQPPYYLTDCGLDVAATDVVATPRIGIAYASEPWLSQPWRFYERGNRWVSKR